MIAALALGSLVVIPLPTHAAVVDSTVDDGGTLRGAVEMLSVSMNEEILQVPGVETANSLTLQDAEGNYYGDGCTSISGRTASMDSALGEAGDYILSYTVISADNHPVSGQISFAWEPTEDYEPDPGFGEPPVCGEALPAPVEPDQRSEDDQQTQPTDGAVPTEDAIDSSDSEIGERVETVDGDASTRTWIFILISIAAAALIFALLVGLWTRKRRMHAVAEKEPENAEEDGEHSAAD